MKKLPLMFLLLGGLPIAGTSAMAAEPASAPAHAAAASAPRLVVEQLDDALLAAMKQARRLGYAGRYRRLAPVVERVYDFPAVAALVLGNQWAKLSPAQQKEFIATLRDYTIATYAARFDGYAGERFAILSVQPLPPNRMVVSSTLTESSGKVHSLDYLMQPVAGRWRVINVVADGVSDLALKQAEFIHLLEQQGFPGLIAGLKSYIAHMAHQGK